MAVTPWDALLLVLIGIVGPLYTYATYPATRRRIAREGEPARLAEYREVVVWELLAVVALAALWLGQGRSWPDIGFGVTSPARFALSMAIAASVIGLLAWQLARVRRSDGTFEEARTQLETLEALLPTTRRERRRYAVVCAGAGLSEEAFWRGYLIWLLAPAVGLLSAAALSVVGFTLAHAYQGARSLPGIALAATAITGLYLIGGSRWAPILLHAAIDWIQGLLAAEISGRWRRAGEGTTASPDGDVATLTSSG